MIDSIFKGVKPSGRWVINTGVEKNNKLFIEVIDSHIKYVSTNKIVFNVISLECDVGVGYQEIQTNILGLVFVFSSELIFNQRTPGKRTQFITNPLWCKMRNKLLNDGWTEEVFTGETKINKVIGYLDSKGWYRKRL
jgi:hypothetical protein